MSSPQIIIQWRQCDNPDRTSIDISDILRRFFMLLASILSGTIYVPNSIHPRSHTERTMRPKCILLADRLSPLSSSPSTLMLGRGTGDDVRHAGLRRAGAGEGLTAAGGLAYGCAVHACRSGSRSEFRSRSSRDGFERHWVRASPSSVRSSSMIGTPYAMFMPPHWCNNAPPVGDTIREGKSGNTMLLRGCCGGRGFSARPCIFKDSWCIGVANARAPGGTVYVPEFPLVSLSSPQTRSPYSLDVVDFCLEAVWAHPETCVLAIVIPARLHLLM